MQILTGFGLLQPIAKGPPWRREGSSLPVRQVERFPPERVLYVRPTPDIRDR